MLRSMSSRLSVADSAGAAAPVRPATSGSPGPHTAPAPHTPPAPRAGLRHAAAFVVVAASLTAVAACGGAAAQSPPSAPPEPTVTVAPALERDLTEWDEITGRLEAVNTVDVRPRVSGYVSSVHFVEGAIVSKGQLLFSIDPRPFQAEVDRLRAEVARARATVTRADSELGRAERLARENAISSEEHDRRGAFAEESRAQMASIEAAVRAAELNLEFTRVVAPIAGRIGRAIVTEGNLVSSGPGEATLLATLVSLDPIYATFDADESAFSRFAGGRSRTGSPGGPAIRMALASEPYFSRVGRLTFLDNQVDSSTGTIRVRALFPNRDLQLMPGLFVRVRVPLAAQGRAVLVQDRAIGTDLDRRYVLTVAKDRTVNAVPVTLGPIVDGLRVVRSGVAGGDLVVVNGLQHTRPGTKVATRVVAMDAAAEERP